MPNRIVREGILTSEPVCSLTWPAEVFYRRLMSVADDHGRFHGIPKLIRAACYPLQIDKVSDADIGKWLTECVTAALVSVYPASDGKRYIQIQKFGQQVRSKSKFPDAIDGLVEQLKSSDSNCYQVQADAHLGVSVFEDVFVIPPADAVDLPAVKKTIKQPSIALQTWIDSLNGEDAIPADDPLYAYADSINLPDAYIDLAWGWFKSAMETKRQKDWRAHFRNAVRGNWPKYWWPTDDGGWRLSPAGEQAKRAAEAKAA